MKKKNKIIILIFMLLIVMGVGIHLFLSPSTVGTSGSKNITDMDGRVVEVPTSINNVVATSPPMSTIIYMLAPDKLKALNFEWTNEELELVPSQYKNLPNIGGWYGSQDGSYEEFIAAKPDIIIEAGDLATVNERQSKFGDIPVVAVNTTTHVDNIDDSILFIGEVIGAQENARKLVDFNDKFLDIVHQKANQIPDNQKKTVYCAVSNDGLTTSPHSQLVDLVGGINVANSSDQGNSTSRLQISMEQVIAWNPDVIITTSTEFYNNVYNDSEWSSINAVKNHQVYLSPHSPFKWFDKPGGANLIIGVPWTAKVIYPDVYSDIDLVNATKEFYSEFYHTDLSDNQVKEMLLNTGLREENL